MSGVVVRILARPWTRITVVAVTAALLVTALAVVALAQGGQELGGKVRTGAVVTVPAGETVPGHLYASGGTIEIEGDVEGDLVATGGQVRVSGTIGGDVLVAGGDITIDGDVGGSTRVAGGQVVVNGQTGEDLAVASGRLRLAQGAGVGSDLLFTAGQVRLDGAVEGDVLGITGDYVETGTVAGTTDVTVATPEEPPTAGERLLDRVQRYVELLLVGAFVLLLARGLSRRAVGEMRRRPLVDLGVGALAFVAAVVGAVVLVIVGVLLAILFALLGLDGLAGLSVTTVLLAAVLVAFALVVTWAFLAPVLVGLLLGGYVVDVERGWLPAFGALALGTLVLVAVFTIPYAGGVAALIVALLGLGALVMLVRRRPSREPDRAIAEPAGPARAG
jgi:hypothetical protein